MLRKIPVRLMLVFSILLAGLIPITIIFESNRLNWNSTVIYFISSVVFILFALLLSLIISRKIQDVVREIELVINNILSGRLDSRADEFKVSVDFRQIINKTNNLIDAFVAQTQEKSRLEEVIQYNQRLEAIGSLAGGIAHDFNNILSYMFAYADIVQSSLTEGTTEYDSMDEIVNAIGRAGELVSQIMTFSRQMKREKKPLKISIIIKEAVKLLKATLPKSIKIESDIKDDDIHIMADPIQAHQIIMNLCTNSYHAMQEQGGTLKISLALVLFDENNILSLKKGRYCRFSVADTGCGMDDYVKSRMFEPFFTTKPPGQGTGMGLSVVRNAIKNLDGAITVESRAHDGTTIDVYLPAGESSVETSVIKEHKAVPSGAGVILFVDDEEHICRSSKMMLENLGYEVVTACGSREALRIFDESPSSYDLVITDFNMPDMNGYELVKVLKKIRRDIRVIMMTGYNDMFEEEKVIAIGVEKIISKPYTKSVIAETIDFVLKKNR